MPSPVSLSAFDGLALSAAMAAARRGGLLHRLAAGPADARTLAADCGLDARVTEALLVALASAGILGRNSGGTYCWALQSPRVLDRLLAGWDDLDHVLRTGVPARSVDCAEVAGSVYADMAGYVEWVSGPPSPAVTSLAGPGRTVLDVGAGTAAWSRALLAAEPSMRATVLDLPPVVEVARQAVERDGLADRYEFVAGDMFTVDLAGRFDVVVVAGVCHLFSGERVRTLLTRVAAWLLPHGEVALATPLPRDSPNVTPCSALYALGLMVRTAGGALHPFSSYATWMLDAGLEDVRLIDPSSALSLIRAQRAY